MTEEPRDPNEPDSRTNPIAILGLCLAAAALASGLISPLLSTALGIAAVACSLIGFIRYRRGYGGRFPAAAGIVVGGAALLVPLAVYLTLPG